SWIGGKKLLRKEIINQFPDDHERLREVLSKIKGKFILSYNDCEMIRELYKEYTIIEVERHDNIVAKSGSRRYKELIIKNY
ncbi:DNA adenine methylase, partial [Faecalimonas sp.]